MSQDTKGAAGIMGRVSVTSMSSARPILHIIENLEEGNLDEQE